MSNSQRDYPGGMNGNPESAPLDREWHALASGTRLRNKKRIRSSLLVALVVALLLWNTQWPAIRPGLFVLLVGQIALAGFLFIRSRQIEATTDLDLWFDREASAMRFAGWLENGSRLVGFAILAFGFWRSTHNLPLSLALGLVYPLVIYWGLTRAATRRETRALNSHRLRLKSLASGLPV